MNTHVFMIVLLIGQFFFVHAHCPASSQVNEEPTQIPDYYWRDYNGVIPKDALEGGTDKDGNPTYIGQAYTHNRILPAIITGGCKIAKTTTNGKFITVDSDIKILCTQHKEKFEWLPTSTRKAATLTADHHLVVGGRGSEHIFYIGRSSYDDRLVIGKINSGHNRGLAIPYKGRRVHVPTYEILTYNFGKETDHIPLVIDIDVRSQ